MIQRGATDTRVLLQQRLENYRRTRALAPASHWQWCDLLIREAEDALQALSQNTVADGAAAQDLEVEQVVAAAELAATEIARLRSTYPFCP